MFDFLNKLKQLRRCHEPTNESNNTEDGPAPPDKALVFIDYESWFYSYQKLYHIKPNPAAFRNELESRFQLVDIMIFADFSYPAISEELPKLREISNTIIETSNTTNGNKKDITDFIMLDYIYQCAATRNDINTYIIFTGDGHFQSVIKYLSQIKGFRVLVYGVRGALSKQLKAVATEAIELPATDELMNSYYKMIIENMEFVSTRSSIIPTFMGTARIVAERNEIPVETIQAALSSMIEQGYLYRTEQWVAFNRKVRIIAANWEVLRKEGLYPIMNNGGSPNDASSNTPVYTSSQTN